jgi:hypothetical protein
LRRDWRFAAVAVLMLALALGLNIAVFSVMDAMLFRGLPRLAIGAAASDIRRMERREGMRPVSVGSSPESRPRWPLIASCSHSWSVFLRTIRRQSPALRFSWCSSPCSRVSCRSERQRASTRRSLCAVIESRLRSSARSA